MDTRLAKARFDQLAAKVADGTATAPEREEFVSAAQKDREILGRVTDWMDYTIKNEAQLKILRESPKHKRIPRACGACQGSGRWTAASEGGAAIAWDWPCPRCAGTGRLQ